MYWERYIHVQEDIICKFRESPKHTEGKINQKKSLESLSKDPPVNAKHKVKIQIYGIEWSPHYTKAF